MAKVNISNVHILENPADFNEPFKFEITFDCHEPLPDDLEWKIVYVGSAETEANDQVLDTVLVGPVPEGRHMFVFSADAPDPSKIPPTEVVGVTVVLLACAYRGQEFIKIGYYVANEYTEQELRDDPPEVPILDKIRRYVISDQPRITRFSIKWDQSGEGTSEGAATENQVQNGFQTATSEPADAGMEIGEGGAKCASQSEAEPKPLAQIENESGNAGANCAKKAEVPAAMPPAVV